MLKNAIAENNNTTNVDFVMVPFGFEQDSTVVVSGAEIKDFYDFTPDDVKVIDYQTHEQIKDIPIAI